MPLFGPVFRQLKLYTNEKQDIKRLVLQRELENYCNIPKGSLLSAELAKRLFPKQRV